MAITVIVRDMREIMGWKIIILILLFYVFISGCISGQGIEKGTLQFTSSPTGAQIYLDNEYRGTTPSTISGVVAGPHTIEFRYPGYTSWSANITVQSDTALFYASLTPVVQSTGQLPGDAAGSAGSQTKVTIQAGKDPMIVGDSNLFSGTGAGSENVFLTLYGPGYYANGVLVAQQKTNAAGLWSYTWNPGSSVQSGSYTMVVNDAKKSASDRVTFSVVGGGEVSISANSYSASKGDTIRFSGRCTTGAQNVLLVLYGPDRYSSGVEVGTLSVMADKTWIFRYALDSTMPTGYYTMYVYDVPRTTSDFMQFSVGFVSG
jgi:PEGA domain